MKVRTVLSDNRREFDYGLHAGPRVPDALEARMEELLNVLAD